MYVGEEKKNEIFKNRIFNLRKKAKKGTDQTRKWIVNKEDKIMKYSKNVLKKKKKNRDTTLH